MNKYLSLIQYAADKPKQCGGDDFMFGDCSVADFVKQATDSALLEITKFIGNPAGHLIQSVINLLLRTTNVDIFKSGIEPIFKITTTASAGICFILLLFAIIRTIVTANGQHIANALLGIFKTALVSLIIIGGTAALLQLSDYMAIAVMKASAGSVDEFGKRINSLVIISMMLDPQSAPADLGLVCFLAIILIIVALFIYVELLFRHAIIAILVAISPIAAAGSVYELTMNWWRKLYKALLQLIFLKPIIALVFALGFSMTTNSKDLNGIISGFLVFLVAMVAWPAIAKLFTFTEVSVAAAGGVGAFVGGMLGAGGKSPVYNQYANESTTETGIRTMKANLARIEANERMRSAQGSSSSNPSTGGGAAASSSSKGAGAAVAKGGAIAGAAVAGLSAVKSTADLMTKHLDNMGSHGGLGNHGMNSMNNDSSSIGNIKRGVSDFNHHRKNINPQSNTNFEDLSDPRNKKENNNKDDTK